MSEEALWWTLFIPIIENYEIAILAENKKDAENACKILLKDKSFKPSPCKAVEKNKNGFNENTKLLLYISDRLKELQFHVEPIPNIPVILIVSAPSEETLSFFTTSHGNSKSQQTLNIVGIFKKNNIISNDQYDLEDAGNLIRIIKHVLRTSLPEPKPKLSYQDKFLLKPIDWKISVKNKEKAEPLLTLFLDEPMRNFIHRLQHALFQMKNAYEHIIDHNMLSQITEKDIIDWFRNNCDPEEKQKTNRRSQRKLAKLDEYFSHSAKNTPKFQPAHILIEGETGAGKSFLRHLISASLKVRDRISYINATTLSKELLEVELFGSIEGIYTGAKTRPGALILKTGGLIFLDEIGDVEAAIQPKLLQYLEDFNFYPVGCSALMFSPTYFIAATNKDLKQMVKENKFREDLYFRFRTHLYMPALRERKSDLKILISYLLQSPHINPEHKVEFISYRAVQTLVEYDYRRGNFRELERILSEAVATAISEESNILLEKHIHKAIYSTIF